MSYYPHPGDDGFSDHTAFGDVWMTSRYAAYQHPTVGNVTFMSYIHEIGHALGLKHPGDYDAVGTGPGGPYLPGAEDKPAILGDVLSCRRKRQCGAGDAAAL